MEKPPRPKQRVRETLCLVVEQNPGIHFRALERAANLNSNGQLRHHLDRLLSQGILMESTDGCYRRYFMVGQYDRRLRPELTHFARKVPRRIARALLSGPRTRTELRRVVGCADSTLGCHLKRLAEMGYLHRERKKNACLYSLVDRDLIEGVLKIRAGCQRRGEPENIVASTRDGDWPSGEMDLSWLVARTERRLAQAPESDERQSIPEDERLLTTANTAVEGGKRRRGQWANEA